MKKQSTTKGFAILSAAGMATKVLSVLYLPFLMKILNDQGWGIYTTSYQFFLFIYVITNSGMPIAISKLISEQIAVKNYKDANKAFKVARTLMIGIGIILTLVLMALAYPIARLNHHPEMAIPIIALAPTIFFTALESSYRGYFQGRGNMVPSAFSQVIEQLGNIIFTLLLAAVLSRYGVVAACAGGTMGTWIGAIFSLIYLMNYYRRHKAFKVQKLENEPEPIRHTSKQLARKVIYYALPITICVGLQFGGDLIDVFNTYGRLAAIGFSGSMQTILYGYLSKYKQLIGVPIAIITALSATILPVISGAAALKNKEEVENGINYALKLCFLISIPSAIGLAVIASPIYKTVFPSHTGGTEIMVYGAVVLVVQSIVLIETTILQSIGKMYLATAYLLIGIAAKIIVNYNLIAIRNINIVGAVIGSFVGFTIPLICNAVLIQKTLNIRIKFEYAVKPIISAIFMGLAVYIVYCDLNFLIGIVYNGYFNNALSTLIAVLAGILTYLYMLILTGALRKEDFQYLPQKLLKLIPQSLQARIR